MAVELVGGALLSAFLQFAFDRLASPQVVDFFRRIKLDEKLLGNSNIMLHSINALVDDAELKQFTDPHVKAWLFVVKEVVFDVEDLLDEIDYELTRCQVEAELEPQTIAYKVSNFINSTFSSFNKRIDLGLKEVLEKLEYLARQKGALGLKECTYFGDGLDADKYIIINWLPSETDNRRQFFLLWVWVGGLGKSTLPQHVYNDPKIDNAKFDSKAWVRVSDNFHVLALTKTMLEAITDRKDDSGNLETIHKKLEKKLSGKKFLLVLDDKGFAKHASKDDNLELNDELKKIGRRIVKECKGLPLALKAIGCLLRTKSSISDWKAYWKADIWDLPKEESEIISTLFLSYHYLPSHLKRCFAYCALFPKDYEFVKEKLILLWMAQNFLECPQQVRHPKGVPDFIGNLKHLQSLELSKTGIQKLRDSTCLLYNLLILKLNFCGYMKELSSNLHKLTKLSCLEFKNTKGTKLPMDLEDLKNLLVRSTFFVHKNSEFNLSIKELQNIMNSSEALAMDLKNKTRLKLKWNKNPIPDDPRKEKELLEILQPSKHLERLSIKNYRGIEFPSWIGCSHL
ncbi:hypothetical protein PHAVU_004G075900 [Phaseolus vulgaris]|uniref:Rx N-terminal domain-containing protein n=1 Tax=Phaseolus vulgaris TaxID=3885 RepID=V7C0Z2_PHAVU|nr:hypothetical protein PHAVU_004G075900g [Phaseolus vulgaris]ESW23794.1 hypothetical protein PHAVU_004G075900g [Phaseolus vulgaris]